MKGVAGRLRALCRPEEIKCEVTIMLLLIINVEAIVVKCHGRKRKESVGNILANIFICAWIRANMLFNS